MVEIKKVKRKQKKINGTILYESEEEAINRILKANPDKEFKDLIILNNNEKYIVFLVK